MLQGLYDILEETIKHWTMDDESSDKSSSGSSGEMDKLDDSSDDLSSDSSDDSSSDYDDRDGSFIFEMDSMSSSSSLSSSSSQDDDDMTTMLDSDNVLVDTGSTASTHSTVGLLINKITAQEQVSFATTRRSYNFDTKNELKIDQLEDTEDTRKIYQFKKHHL
jgi:hypothetical protein